MSLAEGAPVPPLDPLAGGAYHFARGARLSRAGLYLTGCLCWRLTVSLLVIFFARWMMAGVEAE